MIFDSDFDDKKLLVVVPHPDDDLLGTGGLLVKYAKNIDTICVSSSGIPSIDGVYSAEERNKMRIQEWNEVMKRLNVNSTYINSTWGSDFPFINQLNKSLNKMISGIDLSIYDYVFIPGFLENHEEHRWVTYTFMNSLLRRKKHKKDLKIVMYEVWALLPRVTNYLDISNEMDRVLELFQIYESQLKYVDYDKRLEGLAKYESQLKYVDYDKRLEGLAKYRGLMASRVAYAEAYAVMSVSKYKFIRMILGTGLSLKKIIRKMRDKSEE